LPHTATLEKPAPIHVILDCSVTHVDAIFDCYFCSRNFWTIALATGSLEMLLLQLQSLKKKLPQLQLQSTQYSICCSCSVTCSISRSCSLIQYHPCSCNLGQYLRRIHTKTIAPKSAIADSIACSCSLRKFLLRLHSGRVLSTTIV
jgi:hypothetical protein